MSKIITLWVLCIFMVSVGTAANHPLGIKLYEPSEEYVTPHIKWLKPSAKPIRVLFITHRWNMREVVEISQRLDMKYEVFVTDNPIIFASKDTIDDAVVRLRKKLKEKYDLIILKQVTWKDFPSDCKYGILKKVKDGTGLLISSVKKPDVYLKMAMKKKIESKADTVLAGFPYQGVPGFKVKQLSQLFSNVNIYKFGKGTIVKINGYPAPKPRIAHWKKKLLNYDYELSYFIKMMLFASGNLSEIMISPVETSTSIDRNAFFFFFFIIKSPARMKVNLYFTLRNRKNYIYQQQKRNIKLSPGKQKIAFAFKKLPAGEYFADLWIEKNVKKVNFASMYRNVTSKTKIVSLSLKENNFRKGESIDLKVTLAKAEACKLKLKQIDNFGRVIKEKIFSSTSNKLNNLTFSSSLFPLTIIQYLQAEIISKSGEVIDLKKVYFSISNLYPKEDIRNIIWTGNGDILRYKALHEAGFDTQYTDFRKVMFFANMNHISFSNSTQKMFRDWRSGNEFKSAGKKRGLTHRGTDDHVRIPCFTNPETQKKLKSIAIKEAKNRKAFSIYQFSMGDELYFQHGNYELCFSKTCVAEFHKFLKKEYRNIENVNKEYEANYNSFKEIKPVTLKEVNKNPKLIPLWVDYRLHMEKVWAGAFKFVQQAIKNVIPNATTGYEGTFPYLMENSYHAINPYNLMTNALGTMCTYGNSTFMNRAFADFAQTGSLIGLGWIGGYPGSYNRTFQRFIVWRQLFQGANSYWTYKAHHGSPTWSIQAPDYSIYEYYKAHVKELKELKLGTGKLLMNSQRANDRIAVLYSPSSLHAVSVGPGSGFSKNYLSFSDSFCDSLEISGFGGFKIISNVQLAKGVLEKKSFGLLILPFSQALSKQEVKEIKSFVKNGGTVIADLRPGVADGHGKPYAEGALDDVFGVIQNTQKAQAKKSKIKLAFQGINTVFSKTIYDASLKLSGGKSYADINGTPGVVINEYGKGKAVLLNFSLPELINKRWSIYASYNVRMYSPAVNSFFKSLFSFSKVTNQVKVIPNIPNLIQYSFKNGSQKYLGLLAELPECPENYETGKGKALKRYKAVVKLSRKSYLYDIRNGKFLGFTDSFKTNITPSYAKLYALLSYKVDGIILKVPKYVKQGATLKYKAKLITSEGKPGLHIFHVSLISPKGDEKEYYANNLKAEKGLLEAATHLAFNEQTGKWKLRIKDIASGFSVEKIFYVKGKK